MLHIGVEYNMIIGENNSIYENGLIRMAKYTVTSTILKGRVAEVERYKGMEKNDKDVIGGYKRIWATSS